MINRSPSLFTHTADNTKRSFTKDQFSIHNLLKESPFLPLASRLPHRRTPTTKQGGRFITMSEASGSSYNSNYRGHVCDMDQCVLRTSLQLHNFGRRFYGCRHWKPVMTNIVSPLSDLLHRERVAKRSVEKARVSLRMANARARKYQIALLMSCRVVSALAATPVQPKLQHSAAGSALATTPVQPNLQHSAAANALAATPVQQIVH
nr:hypothetical protein CFP56_22631 [Quercus suber]